MLQRNEHLLTPLFLFPHVILPRRVAACRCRRPGCVHLVDRAGVEHPHRADTATDAPTEQPPDRLVEHLALDVPQRLIAPLTAPLTAIPRNENER